MKAKFEPGRGYTQKDWDEVSDNPEITEGQLADFRPFAEAFPDLMESIRKTRGRPPKADAKLAVTLRLDPATVERFKALGPDWRARMGAALKRAAGE
ncbi:MAG: BrnA antitoxin family protein [Amaricoccus sp.]|uniref:BrnA antitoxin family protein n=1 Tax=Amaricoccus sp. TaxID=1872485 RepID=UPI0039E37A21